MALFECSVDVLSILSMHADVCAWHVRVHRRTGAASSDGDEAAKWTAKSGCCLRSVCCLPAECTACGVHLCLLLVLVGLFVVTYLDVFYVGLKPPCRPADKC